MFDIVLIAALAVVGVHRSVHLLVYSWALYMKETKAEAIYLFAIENRVDSDLFTGRTWRGLWFHSTVLALYWVAVVRFVA